MQVTLGADRAKSNHGIVILYGIHDNLVKPVDSLEATFCNKPWKQLFQKTGITEGDLWPPDTVSTSQLYCNRPLCVPDLCTAV